MYLVGVKPYLINPSSYSGKSFVLNYLINVSAYTSPQLGELLTFFIWSSFLTCVHIAHCTGVRFNSSPVLQ